MTPGELIKHGLRAIADEMRERAKGETLDVAVAYSDCAMGVDVATGEICAALEPIAPPDVAQAARVYPLDLSNLMRHAFLSGIVAARNIPGHEECVGVKLWVDYDPTAEPFYHRITTALRAIADGGE